MEYSLYLRISNHLVSLYKLKGEKNRVIASGGKKKLNAFKKPRSAAVLLLNVLMQLKIDMTLRFGWCPHLPFIRQCCEKSVYW